MEPRGCPVVAKAGNRSGTSQATGGNWSQRFSLVFGAFAGAAFAIDCDRLSRIRRGRKRPKQAETVAVGCNQLRPGLDGKERGRRFESVRGLTQSACNSALYCCLSAEHADTFPTHLRYARRTATSRVVFRHVCDKTGRQVEQVISPLRGNSCCPGWRDLDPFPTGGGHGQPNQTAAQLEAAGPARCCGSSRRTSWRSSSSLSLRTEGGRRRRYGSAGTRYGVALSPYHRTRTTGGWSYEHRKEARWLTISRWRTAGSTRARTRR
jgi:hypothetical protein